MQMFTLKHKRNCKLHQRNLKVKIMFACICVALSVSLVFRFGAAATCVNAAAVVVCPTEKTQL
jgi:hypothetical protein